MKLFRSLWELIKYRHPFPAPIDDLANTPLYEEVPISCKRLYIPDRASIVVRMEEKMNHIPRWLFHDFKGRLYEVGEGPKKKGYLVCEPNAYLMPKGIQFTEMEARVPIMETDTEEGETRTTSFDYIFSVTVGYEIENPMKHYERRLTHKGRNYLEYNLVTNIRPYIVALLRLYYINKIEEDKLDDNRLNNLKSMELMGVILSNKDSGKDYIPVPDIENIAKKDQVTNFQNFFNQTHFGVKVKSLLCEFRNKEEAPLKNQQSPAPIAMDFWGNLQDRPGGHLHLLRNVWELIKWRNLLSSPNDKMDTREKCPLFQSVPVTCQTIEQPEKTSLVLAYAPRSTWGQHHIPSPWLYNRGKKIKKMDYLKYQPYAYFIPEEQRRLQRTVVVSRLESGEVNNYLYNVDIAYEINNPVAFYQQRTNGEVSLENYIWYFFQKPMSGLISASDDLIRNRAAICLFNSTSADSWALLNEEGQNHRPDDGFLYELNLLKKTVELLQEPQKGLTINSIQVNFNDNRGGE